MVDPGPWQADGAGPANTVPGFTATTPLGAPIPQVGRATTLFADDLNWSVRAVVGAPLLIMVSALIVVIQELPRFFNAPKTDILALAVTAPLVAGLAGAQRIWLLHLRRGEGFDLHTLWPMTRAFMGRFICLALLAMVGLLPVYMVAAIVNDHQSATTPSGQIPLSIEVYLIASTFVLDLVLTFVAPALAFSVRSARLALRVGLRLLIDSWPTTAWYALTPGLTVSVLPLLVYRSTIGTGGDIAITLAATVASLCFKGAAVSYYLRSFPETPYEGSALAAI